MTCKFSDAGACRILPDAVIAVRCHGDAVQMVLCPFWAAADTMRILGSGKKRGRPRKQPE